MLFVKRDVVTVYKQTVLGPLWYLIQPLFTSITFTIIFNTVAGIETGTIPPFLFNLAGITIWNYFTSCLNDTSDTFKTYFSPANKFDLANTLGESGYLFVYEDGKGSKIEIESEMNTLNLMRRPQVVVRAVKGATV